MSDRKFYDLDDRLKIASSRGLTARFSGSECEAIRAMMDALKRLRSMRNALSPQIRGIVNNALEPFEDR